MQRFVDPLVGEYLFDLPDELIARYPVEPGDACRLLRVSRSGGDIEDGHFYDLPGYLQDGDLLVVNDTRVEARRIFLRRLGPGNKPGARIESVFLEVCENPPAGARNNCWSVLIKKRQRLKDGEILVSEAGEGVYFTLHKYDDGRTFLEESTPLDAEMFYKIGQMPIPPYLQREEEAIDRRAYQNPFYDQTPGTSGGSVAAPTASLHFTPNILLKLKEKNIRLESLTLDVGYGTFAPLREENFSTGRLHEERYELPQELADTLARKDYNRLYAVGTTSLRVLESVHIMTSGKYDHHLKGKTGLFLHPPHRIASVDGMITNFHLPGSSLLMLVSCLLEKDRLMKCYRHAIEKRYRFFSYGDAMLIQP